MDLPTHVAFGFAMGLVFFDKPEIALLIALGSLFPDLDREYWFVPKKTYADEQVHRAALHNVFIMALAYLVNPFFSLGIFFHVMQDSFTTVKDRGVEWFYPLTRLVKRGLYDGNGKRQPLDPKEKIYFHQQDSRGLVDMADPDLREYGCNPVPWRRVYGFAQNSNILDRAFLYTSIVIILIWHLAPGNNQHLLSWSAVPDNFYFVTLVGYVSLMILYLTGELDRHNKIPSRLFMGFDVVKYPIFAIGLIIFVIWLILFWDKIEQNLVNIFYNPLAFSMEAVLIPLVIIIMIRQKTKKGTPAVV